MDACGSTSRSRLLETKTPSDLSLKILQLQVMLEALTLKFPLPFSLQRLAKSPILERAKQSRRLRNQLCQVVPFLSTGASHLVHRTHRRAGIKYPRSFDIGGRSHASANIVTGSVTFLEQCNTLWTLTSGSTSPFSHLPRGVHRIHCMQRAHCTCNRLKVDTSRTRNALNRPPTQYFVTPRTVHHSTIPCEQGYSFLFKA